MNKEYIEHLKNLDKDGLDGNIQGFLMMDNLEDISVGSAFLYLTEVMYHSKMALVRDNIEQSNNVQSLNLQVKELESQINLKNGMTNE